MSPRLSPVTQSHNTQSKVANKTSTAWRRILRRKDIASSGGIALAEMFGPKLGPLGAIRPERQVILVDSSILITRGVPNRKSSENDENEKDYFAVWRRVERGTLSSRRQ